MLSFFLEINKLTQTHIKGEEEIFVSRTFYYYYYYYYNKSLKFSFNPI